MNNNRNISTFSPFITFCQHVIPLAYDESMSYYETLCALRDYLINTVIPAVNNNADAVTELQNKYTEFTNNINKTVNDLESYIDNYFNNLDVQTEINNKLDKMAESGELTDIIAQYLQLASVLAFNTRTDLKNANNLNNGSFTYCFGKQTYNDGFPAFYKIRKLVNTDEIDGENLIALTNYPTLVAEKMPDKNFDNDFSSINDNINSINEEIDNLDTKLSELKNNVSNLKNRKFIFIGDSYGSGEIGSSWITNVISYLGLTINNNAFDYSKNASGFTISNNTFEMCLDRAIQNITNKDEITDIIVCGGYNDGAISSSSEDEIVTAISSFVTKMKTNFVNATLTLGEIGWTRNYSKLPSLRKAIFAYRRVSEFGQKYITNIEYSMHNYSFFASDDIHPTAEGNKAIARNVVSGILTGVCDVQYRIVANETFLKPVSGGFSSMDNNVFITTVNNGMCTLSMAKVAGASDNYVSSTTGSKPIALNSNQRAVVYRIDKTQTCVLGQGEYFKDFKSMYCLVTSGTNQYINLQVGITSGEIILANNTNTNLSLTALALPINTFIFDSLYC